MSRSIILNDQQITDKIRRIAYQIYESNTKEKVVILAGIKGNGFILAERIAKVNPHLGAYPSQIKGGNTEMADALRVGIPAITLNGMGPKGEMPYWHQAEDTFDNMDPEVMARAYEFAWEYITAIDSMLT